MLNMDDAPLDFECPTIDGRRWLAFADTAQAVARRHRRARRRSEPFDGRPCTRRGPQHRRPGVPDTDLTPSEEPDTDGLADMRLHLLRPDRRVRRRRTTADDGQLHAADDRRPRVRGRAHRRRPSPSGRATSARPTSTRPARCATCSTAGASSSPTASSIPRAATTRFEAKHIVFVGRTRARVRLRAPGLVGQPGPRARATSTCEPSSADGDDRLPRLPHAAHARGRASSTAHAAGDRHDLAPGLRLRDRVPADRRGPVPRGGREGHRVPARAHAHRSTRTRASSTGTTASTSPAASEQKILASEFGDDYDAIPAYEQIYALAGPTQTFRITGDPRILQRHRADARALRPLLPRPRGRAATSRTSTRSRSTRAASRSAHNRARKNWNSVGDHAPGYLINLCLATGDDAVRRLPRATPPTRSSTHFPDYDNSPFVQEKFHEDWTHDQHVGLAAEPRRRRAQPEDRLEPDAHPQPAAERRSTSSSREKIAELMPTVGSDRQRGGWYDVMERELQPTARSVHRFVWHDRKAWWQQEQAILAYLILAGILGRRPSTASRRASRPRSTTPGSSTTTPAASTSTCWRTACRTCSAPSG